MEGMGFSLAVSQCLVTPPYILAAIATWFVAFYADKWKVRSPFVLVNCTLIIVGKSSLSYVQDGDESANDVVGLCLIGFVETVGVRYFGVFLACAPSTANAPAILSWQANNVRGISEHIPVILRTIADDVYDAGQWKRALVSALSVGFGAIGGITGYRQSSFFRSIHYADSTC